MTYQNKTKLAQNTLIACLFPFALLSGCGGESSTGTASLSITDAPVDTAENVVIRFTGIEINSSNGDEDGWQSYGIKDAYGNDVDYVDIDLLTLQGTDSQNLLNGIELSSGEYKVRFNIDVDESYIVVPGGDAEGESLKVPSGDQTGLKVPDSIFILAGADVNFTVDFDVRKFITYAPGQGYIMNPTSLRIVQNDESGHIEGLVDESLATSCDNAESPVVYAFNDVYSSVEEIPEGAEEVSSSLISDAEGVYSYAIGYLNAGDYTVAFNCVDIEADTNNFKAVAPANVEGNNAISVVDIVDPVQ